MRVFPDICAPLMLLTLQPSMIPPGLFCHHYPLTPAKPDGGFQVFFKSHILQTKLCLDTVIREWEDGVERQCWLNST